METNRQKAAPEQFTCVGCEELILDQYVLRVAPDMEWHVHCLRCTDCQQLLDETCTCFVRDGKVYCKPDYLRSDSVQLELEGPSLPISPFCFLGRSFVNRLI